MTGGPASDQQPISGDEPEASDDKPSQATSLRRLALELYDFGCSADGRPYAVAKDGPRVALPFRGSRSGMRAELARTYALRNGGTVPKGASLADALTALEGEAAQRDPWDIALRVAERDGVLWLDLGDTTGRVVRVTPEGWDLRGGPDDVMFRRTGLTSALPAPTRGGDLGPLWQRLNVAEEDRPLIVAWFILALIPGMPHPILTLTGEQGTGKSTAAKLLGQLVDASSVPLRTAPRDADAWAVTAAASYVIALDNLSGVPAPWLSDAMCRAVTGDGLARRVLYSDDDVTGVSFRRCLIANGIDVATDRGDLGERMVAVDLGQIKPKDRRTAAAVEMPDADRSRVLGALLDKAVDVLAVLPGIDLAEMPRMADYARVLAALDKLDSTAGLTRYIAQAKVTAASVVDADPYAAAILSWLRTWAREASEGSKALDPDLFTLDALDAAIERPDPLPRTWPASPNAKGAVIRRAAPGLRELGAYVDTDTAYLPKHATSRRAQYKLGPGELSGDAPSDPSDPSEGRPDQGERPEGSPKPHPSNPDPDPSDGPATEGSQPPGEGSLSGTLRDAQGSDLPKRPPPKPPKGPKGPPETVHPAPLCEGCGDPLDAVLAGRGETTHANCEPA